MHRREFVLSATGILGATTVGSIAYTSATVNRGVTATVESDSAAIIKLVAGNTNAVTTSNNQLQINPDSGNNGLNTDATFNYGASSTISNDNAFTITNKDDSAHSLKLKLNNMTEPGTSSFSIEIFSGDSTSLGTVDSGNDLTINSSNWGNGTTLYAQVTITTDDGGDTSNISGDLVLTAN
jgi:hypothetical protein